jgi:hypothetical protein
MIANIINWMEHNKGATAGLGLGTAGLGYLGYKAMQDEEERKKQNGLQV